MMCHERHRPKLVPLGRIMTRGPPSRLPEDKPGIQAVRRF